MFKFRTIILIVVIAALAYVAGGATAGSKSNPDNEQTSVLKKISRQLTNQRTDNLDQASAMSWLTDALNSLSDTVNEQLTDPSLRPDSYLAYHGRHLTCDDITNGYNRRTCQRLCPGFDLSFQRCVRDFMPLTPDQLNALNGGYAYYGDDNSDDTRWVKTLTAKRNNYVAKKMGKVKFVNKDLSAIRDGEGGWTDPANLEGMSSVSYLPAAATLLSKPGAGTLNRLLVVKKSGVYRAVLFTSDWDGDLAGDYPYNHGAPDHGAIRIHYVVKGNMFP